MEFLKKVTKVHSMDDLNKALRFSARFEKAEILTYGRTISQEAKEMYILPEGEWNSYMHSNIHLCIGFALLKDNSYRLIISHYLSHRREYKITTAIDSDVSLQSLKSRTVQSFKEFKLQCLLEGKI